VAEDVAARLAAFIGDRHVLFDDAAAATIEGHPNRMRYAAPTGRVAIRWDGARQPLVWIVPRPDVTPAEARRDLARRYLHVFGPSTAMAFAGWAGISAVHGGATFKELAARDELVPTTTPIGDAHILASDEAPFRRSPSPTTVVRLLPSGDTFYLLHGADRELLVPDPGRRALLWTPRVWPGALLIEGQVAGTWRRDRHALSVSAWRGLSAREKAGIEEEAASLPLPDLGKPIAVTWED
jgi:hypothetical protein